MKITTADDLRTAAFWWRFAFLPLGFASVMIFAMYFPKQVYLIPVALGLFGWLFLRGWPFDVAGAAIAGILVSLFISPGIELTFFEQGALAAHKLGVLAVLAAILLVAMIVGFLVGRWVGHAKTLGF